MMSIADLKLRLHDIAGIENLTMQELAGRQNFGLDGKVISLDPNADANTIEDAIRQAVASPLIAQIPLGSPSQALIPKVAVAPRQARTGASMSVTGAGHAGMTLKQMMDSRKQAMADAHAKLQSGFAKLDQATAALTGVGDKVAAEADDLLATVGQFTNEIGGITE